MAASNIPASCITGPTTVWRPSLSLSSCTRRGVVVPSMTVSLSPLVLDAHTHRAPHDIEHPTREMMCVALLSLAMRSLPMESAAVPGLSTRLSALLEGKVESLEDQLHDLRSSQSFATRLNHESTIAYLRDQIAIVVSACDGLEQENASASYQAAVSAEDAAALRIELQSTYRTIAMQKAAGLRAAQELAIARAALVKAVGGRIAGLQTPKVYQENMHAQVEHPATHTCTRCGHAGTDATLRLGSGAMPFLTVDTKSVKQDDADIVTAGARNGSSLRLGLSSLSASASNVQQPVSAADSALRGAGLASGDVGGTLIIDVHSPSMRLPPGLPVSLARSVSVAGGLGGAGGSSADSSSSPLSKGATAMQAQVGTAALPAFRVGMGVLWI